MNLDYIKNQFQKELPGEKAHQEMAPVNRPLTSFMLQQPIQPKESAVSIIFNNYHTIEPEIILIQRPEYNGYHGGQISFPGGKKEAHDNTLLDTAIRETNEEIGLVLNEELLIREISQVYIPVSNFLVQPYVFFNEEKLDLTLESHEVVNTIHISISDLLNPNSVSTFDYVSNQKIKMKNVPCFKINDKIIWGATALMLNEVKLILKF